jgi:AraC-like DNA-binding protein
MTATMTSGSPDTRSTKRRRENTEYIGFVQRVVRGLRRRTAEEGDLVALQGLAELRAQLDDELLAAITELRTDRWAYSWAEIADAMGMSRSAVHERFQKAGGVRQAGGQPLKWR